MGSWQTIITPVVWLKRKKNFIQNKLKQLFIFYFPFSCTEDEPRVLLCIPDFYNSLTMTVTFNVLIQISLVMWINVIVPRGLTLLIFFWCQNDTYSCLNDTNNNIHVPQRMNPLASFLFPFLSHHHNDNSWFVINDTSLQCIFLSPRW